MKLSIDISSNRHNSSKDGLTIISAYLAGNLADNRQELTFCDGNQEEDVRLLMLAKRRIEKLLDEINREQGIIKDVD